MLKKIIVAILLVGCYSPAPCSIEDMQVEKGWGPLENIERSCAQEEFDMEGRECEQSYGVVADDCSRRTLWYCSDGVIKTIYYDLDNEGRVYKFVKAEHLQTGCHISYTRTELQ